MVGQENANCTRATCSREARPSTDIERRRKKDGWRGRGSVSFELGCRRRGDGGKEIVLVLASCVVATLRWNAFPRLLPAGGRLVFLRVKGDESDGEIPLPRLHGGGGLERSIAGLGAHILRRGGPTSHGDVSIELIRAESTRSSRVTPLNEPRKPESPTLLDPNWAWIVSFNRSLTRLVDRDVSRW